MCRTSPCGANAAPEWQARSLGCRSIELAGACPLEGLVRRSWSCHTIESNRFSKEVMENHKSKSPQQKASRIKRSCIIGVLAIFIGGLLPAPRLGAQELYSFERFKAANRNNSMMPFRNMLPKTLPTLFRNGNVIIKNYGNHCSEYMVISSKASIKGIQLIPFRRFPTMDASGVVGASFPSLSNIAAFKQSLDPLTRKFFDPFSHNAFRNGSAISVMSCGGRVDGPELRRKVDVSLRALLPDGRKAFFVNSFFNKWSSWCVYDNKESLANQNIPQSGFICVSIDSDDTKALDILNGIVAYSKNSRD